MENSYLWWKDGVIYQIYPRSFADSNNDGIGDLQGIIGKLDYLQDLGIDGIWLSPFFPSPDIDFGYDITDHCAVDPRFGSLEDFDVLVKESHKRGIRIIVDLVLNHTSDQHHWFKESRATLNNAKRDWYLWQSTVPNNWQSVFGGGGWEKDRITGEYYFHMFVKEQPDVNWHNPQVREAQLEVVRFWMNRGVDGFRLDVFNAYFKDPGLKNNPGKCGIRAFDRQKHIHDIDQPEMIGLLKELRSILDEKNESYAVGETFLATPGRTASYCGTEKLHAAFNFVFTRQPAKPEAFKKAISDWDLVTGTDVWPNYVLSNHDLPRSASRYARDGFGPWIWSTRDGKGKSREDDTYPALLMALLMTLRGTPFLYYGEEIGMRDIRLKRREILDPPGKYYWPFYKGRDGCRSPMQWNDSRHGGFSDGSGQKPWLPVHPNYQWRNVDTQKKNAQSLLNLTKNLIALRKEHEVLRRGEVGFVPSPKGFLRYTRSLAGKIFLVSLDFRRTTPDQINQNNGEEVLFRAWNDRILISKEV